MRDQFSVHFGPIRPKTWVIQIFGKCRQSAWPIGIVKVVLTDPRLQFEAENSILGGCFRVSPLQKKKGSQITHCARYQCSCLHPESRPWLVTISFCSFLFCSDRLLCVNLLKWSYVYKPLKKGSAKNWYSKKLFNFIFIFMGYVCPSYHNIICRIAVRNSLNESRMLLSFASVTVTEPPIIEVYVHPAISSYVQLS